MSCQLLLAATFDDIAKVQKYLCTETYKDDFELQSSTAAAGYLKKNGVYCIGRTKQSGFNSHFWSVNLSHFMNN